MDGLLTGLQITNASVKDLVVACQAVMQVSEKLAQDEGVKLLTALVKVVKAHPRRPVLLAAALPALNHAMVVANDVDFAVPFVVWLWTKTSMQDIITWCCGCGNVDTVLCALEIFCTFQRRDHRGFKYVTCVVEAVDSYRDDDRVVRLGMVCIGNMCRMGKKLGVNNLTSKDLLAVFHRVMVVVQTPGGRALVSTHPEVAVNVLQLSLFVKQPLSEDVFQAVVSGHPDCRQVTKLVIQTKGTLTLEELVDTGTRFMDDADVLQECILAASRHAGTEGAGFSLPSMVPLLERAKAVHASNADVLFALLEFYVKFSGVETQAAVFSLLQGVKPFAQSCVHGRACAIRVMHVGLAFQESSIPVLRSAVKFFAKYLSVADARPFVRSVITSWMGRDVRVSRRCLETAVRATAGSRELADFFHQYLTAEFAPVVLRVFDADPKSDPDVTKCQSLLLRLFRTVVETRIHNDGLDACFIQAIVKVMRDRVLSASDVDCCIFVVSRSKYGSALVGSEIVGCMNVACVRFAACMMAGSKEPVPVHYVHFLSRDWYNLTEAQKVSVIPLMISCLERRQEVLDPDDQTEMASRAVKFLSTCTLRNRHAVRLFPILSASLKILTPGVDIRYFEVKAELELLIKLVRWDRNAVAAHALSVFKAVIFAFSPSVSLDHLFIQFLKVVFAGAPELLPVFTQLIRFVFETQLSSLSRPIVGPLGHEIMFGAAEMFPNGSGRDQLLNGPYGALQALSDMVHEGVLPRSHQVRFWHLLGKSNEWLVKKALTDAFSAVDRFVRRREFLFLAVSVTSRVMT